MRNQKAAWMRYVALDVAVQEFCFAGGVMLDGKKAKYIRKIVDLYVNLPQTPNRCAQSDVQLASKWYQLKVKAKDVEAAMLLATARRLFRPNSEENQLGPIRTLHYFVPVLQEVIQKPLTSEYLDYLRIKMNQEFQNTKKK